MPIKIGKSSNTFLQTTPSKLIQLPQFFKVSLGQISPFYIILS